MRMRVALAVVVMLSLAVPAGAQRRDDEEGLKVGDFAAAVEAKEWLYVESEEDIPSITELRGMIVVLFFWTSWHEGGEALLPYVNMLEHNPSIGRYGGVFIMGVTDADREATQPLTDKAKVFFPVALESKAAEEYGITGSFGFVIIDPEGKIAYKSSERVSVDNMAQEVIELMGEKPPSKTHPMEAKVCYRLIDRARDCIRDQQYPKAHKLTREAIRRAVLGDRLTSSAAEMIDLLDQLGYDELAHFEPLREQGRYDEAVALLRRVIRRYRGLHCYLDAKALYKKLEEKDEKFKLAAAKYADEDEAARLYLDARDDLRARRFVESYQKLKRITTEYPRTEAAEYAEAMLERMRQNRRFWQLIMDEEAAGTCRELLARARGLKARGRYAEARALLRRILDEHPDTKWAEEAKQELIDMP